MLPFPAGSAKSDEDHLIGGEIEESHYGFIVHNNLILIINHFALLLSFNKSEKGRSERGYLVRILASRPGVPGSNPIATPKSLVMD